MCDGPRADVLFEIPDRMSGVPGRFTYRRCASCGTVFQDPRVIDEDLPLCYPATYYTHAASMPAKTEAAAAPRPGLGRAARDALRQATAAAVRRQPTGGVVGLTGRMMAAFGPVRVRAFNNSLPDQLLPRSPHPGRALDIGCGSGDLLASLAAVGWEAEGLDVDPAAAEAARRRTGLRIAVGDFQRMDLPLGAYSLVVLSHVFEHLAEPRGALRRLHELLAPRGRAVMISPNPLALGARVYGEFWFPWEAPRHLVLATPRALARAARAAGFRVVVVRSRCASLVGVAAFLAASRAHRDGRPANADLRPVRRDRMLTRVEQVLVKLGLVVGEDMIAVLERAA